MLCCVVWFVDPRFFISVLRQHCILIISILQSTSASSPLVADYSSSKLFSFLTEASHLCIVHLQSLREGLEDVPMFAQTTTNYLGISSNIDYHQGTWSLIVTVRDSKKHLSYFVASFSAVTVFSNASDMQEMIGRHSKFCYASCPRRWRLDGRVKCIIFTMKWI